MLFEVTLSGVTLGGMYALVAMGLTLQYGVARIMNLSYGELLIAAAFALGRFGADVGAAIGSASKAFPAWRDGPHPQRTKVLFAFRALVDAHREELAEIITREHGKVLSDALGEVARGLEVIDHACGIPTLLQGRFSEQASTGIDVYSIRQPLGVCAGITPFNFPLILSSSKLAPALAAGFPVAELASATAELHALRDRLRTEPPDRAQTHRPGSTTAEQETRV